jgi:hypothetical protein
MKNLDEDPEKIADIFFPAYYGPAAPQMRKLFDEIRAGVKPYPKMQTTMVVAAWPFITKKFMLDSYLMLKKAEESLPVNSVYRRHVRHERNAFVWAILANWPSYDKTFAAKGIKRDALLKECQSLVDDYINRYPRKKGKFLENKFEQRFKMVKLDLPKPEKFKNVPEENFRMIAYPNFRGVSHLGSAIVNDPDSITGKALKSAHKDPIYHGVNKRLPGKYNFYTTHFKWGNHKAPGAVELYLTQVPQDEKYHWFRMPGKFEMKPLSYFWGQGWAIQASTSHLYTLTDGNPLDNTWDQVWVSAKFTGPAYVPGSTKENAIYVDMAVLVRSGKDLSYKKVQESMFPSAPAASFPKGWISDRKNTKLEHKDGKTTAIVNSNNRIVGPHCPVSDKENLALQIRTNIPGCRTGFFFYNKDKKYLGAAFFHTADGLNNFTCDVASLKFAKNVATFRLTIAPPKGTKGYTVDNVEVKIAKNQ